MLVTHAERATLDQLLQHPPEAARGQAPKQEWAGGGLFKASGRRRREPRQGTCRPATSQGDQGATHPASTSSASRAWLSLRERPWQVTRRMPAIQESQQTSLPQAAKSRGALGAKRQPAELTCGDRCTQMTDVTAWELFVGKRTACRKAAQSLRNRWWASLEVDRRSASTLEKVGSWVPPSASPRRWCRVGVRLSMAMNFPMRNELSCLPPLPLGSVRSLRQEAWAF